MKLDEIKLEVGKSYLVWNANDEEVNKTMRFTHQDGRYLEVLIVYKWVMFLITISNERELKRFEEYDENEGIEMTVGWEEPEKFIGKWEGKYRASIVKEVLIKGSQSDYDEINDYDYHFWDTDALEANGWKSVEEGFVFYGPLKLRMTTLKRWGIGKE